MTPLTACRLTPKLSSPSTGCRNPRARLWNAMTPPTVIAPSSTRRPPRPRTTATESWERTAGAAPIIVSTAPARCCPSSSVAWMPARRARKSSSAPVPFSVSMVSMPPIDAPASRPWSLTMFRFMMSR